jgi:shikimate kinase
MPHGQPDSARPVVFIGAMATGKSVLGAAYAARRGLRFVDTDRLIVERNGDIPGIFAAEGEQGFRDIEARTVAEVLRSANGEVVVSLGGGAVMDAGTRGLLADTTVVLLEADLETVLPRIRRARGRPMLADNPAARWLELHELRSPVYRELADLVLDTRGRSLADLVDEIVSRVDPDATTESRTPRDG